VPDCRIIASNEATLPGLIVGAEIQNRITALSMLLLESCCCVGFSDALHHPRRHSADLWSKPCNITIVIKHTLRAIHALATSSDGPGFPSAAPKHPGYRAPVRPPSRLSSSTTIFHGQSMGLRAAHSRSSTSTTYLYLLTPPCLFPSGETFCVVCRSATPYTMLCPLPRLTPAL
jgi:hypothetical protein